MNRFIRKEWEDTEIPEKTYLRARNRAWSRLTGSATVSKRWVYAIVSATAVGAVLLIPVLIEEKKLEEPKLLPLPFSTGGHDRLQALLPDSVQPPIGSDSDNSENEPRHQVPLKMTRSVGTQTHLTDSQEPKTSQQVVLNFRLPRTGVRMIWFLGRKPKSDGGT